MRSWNPALLPLALIVFLPSAMCAPQSAPNLTISKNAIGEVVASVSGMIPSCGVTATSGGPIFRIQGAVVTVTQGVAGFMCTNAPQPPPKKLYERTVNFGKLTDGTYTINWSYPELTGTITVTGNPANVSR